METKSFICINCPLGCPLTVTVENGEVKSVTGNTCKRGELYAVKEVTAPARTVTSTVRVLNGERPVVAVRTKTDIPKGKIFGALRRARNPFAYPKIRTGRNQCFALL